MKMSIFKAGIGGRSVVKALIADGLLAAMLAVSAYGQAQGIAEARFHCLSLRFQRATATGLGPNYTLDLTSLSPQESPNGELYPLWDPLDYSHSSNFILKDPSSGESVMGILAVDVPPFSDVNANRISDFFETDLGVASTTTEGGYATPVDQGAIRAHWTRPAGLSLGSCRLQLTSSQFGALPEYIAPFEVVEYSGRLNYTPAKTTVNGTISLTNLQNNGETISGPVSLVKTSTNGLIRLTLPSGHWTNASGQDLRHILTDLDPFAADPSRYLGYVEFVDFDPNTGGDDYFDWLLMLHDPNDSDGDGIPDMSDEPGAPARPQLQLAIDRAAGTMTFRITGSAGRSVVLEGKPDLPSILWTEIRTVTLANDPSLLQLPWPESFMMFYRLRMN